ncbi:MAG TPA: class I SAM-dependent methyltransferase [Methylomirabilota bacterium]|nr:class I SAM-dependent methyltransferase [Methylomirabilota bacterium]
MVWDIFEHVADRYDAWYDTPRGQRVEWAERTLLHWLLGRFPNATSLLDVGCGTGRFTTWLAGRHVRVFGLDRSPAMLVAMRKRHQGLPAILGDGHRLPLRTGAVDLTLLLATLEFLEEPLVALAEAVRVSRQGVLLLVLNRWSVGGLSRRIGPQARGSLLGQARDLTLFTLRAMAQRAAGHRLRALSWSSTLFPDGLWAVRARLPLGDVLGMAVALRPPGAG